MIKIRNSVFETNSSSTHSIIICSQAEYEQLDRIREIRNYWAHQCYLDYVYISNNLEHESVFQRIARRLTNEHNQIFNLHHKLQDLYFDWFGEK